jgi:hypothetical protein
MIRLIPIGTSDFRKLREHGYEYVDKTHFITEIIDRHNIEVVLLPAPAPVWQVDESVDVEVVFRET